MLWMWLMEVAQPRSSTAERSFPMMTHTECTVAVARHAHRIERANQLG
jgi:hypothetical protein